MTDSISRVNTIQVQTTTPINGISTRTQEKEKDIKNKLIGGAAGTESSSSSIPSTTSNGSSGGPHHRTHSSSSSIRMNELTSGTSSLSSSHAFNSSPFNAPISSTIAPSSLSAAARVTPPSPHHHRRLPSHNRKISAEIILPQPLTITNMTIKSPTRESPRAAWTTPTQEEKSMKEVPLNDHGPISNPSQSIEMNVIEKPPKGLQVQFDSIPLDPEQASSPANSTRRHPIVPPLKITNPHSAIMVGGRDSARARQLYTDRENGSNQHPSVEATISPTNADPIDAYSYRVSVASMNAMSVTQTGTIVPQKMMILPKRRVDVSPPVRVISPIHANMPARPSLPPTSSVSPPAVSDPLNHEVFEGRNLLLFGGRLVFGPQWTQTLTTFLIILIPSILFLVFPAAELATRSTQFGSASNAIDTTGLGVTALVFGSMLLVLTEYFLLLTATADPGILPRLRYRLPQDAAFIETQGATLAEIQRAAQVRQMNSNRPRLLTLVLQSAGIGTNAATGASLCTELKYCDSCDIHRPPRTVHCNICCNCVEKFDHHCSWIGTCVGLRNYRSYNLFLYALSSLMILIVIISCIHLKVMSDDRYARSQLEDGFNSSSRAESFASVLHHNPISLLLVGIVFVLSFFVFTLTGLHIYLISSGLTTNEYVKGIWTPPSASSAYSNSTGSGPNPFDFGCWGNWRAVFLDDVGVESHLHLQRPATKHPPLPSAVSTDAIDLEVHGKVRYIDGYEMSELEDEWMRRQHHQRIHAAHPIILPTQSQLSANLSPILSISPSKDVPASVIAVSSTEPESANHAADPHLSIDYPSHRFSFMSLPLSPPSATNGIRPTHASTASSSVFTFDSKQVEDHST